MSSVEPEKWYVVFRGKETGIFRSWPDAEDQVYKFKHNAHKSYLTFAAAQKAWLEFLAKHPKHEANRRTTCDEGRTSHSSVGGPSNTGNDAKFFFQIHILANKNLVYFTRVVNNVSIHLILN